VKELINELIIAFSVIPVRLRRKLAVIVAASTVGVFLELLSLGFLLSAIRLLLDDKSMATLPIIGQILSNVISSTEINTMIVGLCLLLILFFIKSFYMTYFLIYQSRFAYEVQERLSSILFSTYLHIPHKTEQKGTTTSQIRNIITEVPVYVTNVLIYGMQLLSELVPLLATVAFLMYIDFSGTLYTSFGAVLIGVIYHLATKTRVKRYGLIRQEAENIRIREINHSLISKREILIYDLFDKCSKRFDDVNNRLCRTAYSQSVLQQLPRHWFEFTAIFAIVCLAYHLSSTLDKKDDLVVILGVFAFGAFKLLPSINRILLCTQAIRYGMPSAHLLHKELETVGGQRSQSEGRAIDHFQSLKISDLSFRYGDSKDYVISGLDLTLKKGEWVAIVGQSGSGKTTLLELILGLIKPTSGNIYINETKIQDVDLHSFYKLIGYVPQDVFIYDDTITNNVTYWDNNIDAIRLSQSIGLANLTSLVSNSSGGLNELLTERGGNISGGQKQRIAIARSLYRKSDLIIMDEATGALDKDTEIQVLNEMKASGALKGVTLLAITHSLECLHLFDKVIRMEEQNTC
jgi:ABC-type multidrug transport system fused ATPase/permease subunit